MNKEWADKNKKMQSLIAKEAGFREGIEVLLDLRNDLFGQITAIVNNFPKEAFWQMPFAGADGYHSKTLAYSMWHIFRIEDIVAHTLILNDSQVLFRDDWPEKTKSPIITTGNELQGEEIAAFSEKLDVKAVFNYCKAVKEATDELLKGLEYKDLKRKFADSDRERVVDSHSVSTDENAFWLVDYWCGKDIKGLIQMPFSRHWIMHVEAMCRIKNRLCKITRKGVNPVAYCGLSCDHCFLKEWCGACRTCYNCCSNATCSPEGVCPNAACCKEKQIEGCWECSELEDCEKGFYANGLDGTAAKAQALFVRKYGMKAMLQALNRIAEAQGDREAQNLIGSDVETGMKILEENR